MKYLLSILYRIGYKFHHGIFLRKGKPIQHGKIIVVGSFLAGGAGKTPFCLTLSEFLKPYRVAVLCHEKAWDEKLLLQQRIPFAKVISTRNRYRTAHELAGQFDYIICDDGFEDSRLSGAIQIRLDWDTPPTKVAQLIPAGKNRSLLRDHTEPDLILKCFGDNPDVKFQIGKIANSLGQALTLENPVSVACGLGNPERFVGDLERCGVHVARTFFCRDHAISFQRKLDALEKDGLPIVMSEKDFVRLDAETQKKDNIYVAYQMVDISPERKAEIRTLLNIVL